MKFEGEKLETRYKIKGLKNLTIANVEAQFT